MKRILPNTEQKSVTVQQGWEQMKLLLDASLPVNNHETIRNLYFSLSVAAGLFIIFTFTSLHLQNSSPHLYFTIETSSANKAKERNINSKISIGFSRIDKLYNTQNLTSSTEKAAKIDKDQSRPYPDERVTENKIISPETLLETTLVRFIKQSRLEVGEDTNKPFSNYVVNVPRFGDSSWRSTAPDKNMLDNKWSLSAGLAINTQLSKSQNLRPFPVVHVRYNISPRYFVSGGVMAGASLSGRNKGVVKTVYLNDTINNIQYYDQVTNFQEIYYADIPLALGMNLAKNLAVVGGVQASILLKAKTTSSINTYNYQRVSSNVPVNALAIPSVSEDRFDVKVREVDYRISSGLKYTLNKMSYNVIYQKSLRPVMYGNYINSRKNELLTFSIQYKIW